ncbi:rod shape-determining protein MreC [uncultured Arcticibacterium sp.]|uniref:rod shape-determining protein MreC n=1 Tax=uncultured Arcticibacterium sp. TaxID=2173042 RepID=UPI0030FCAECB
MSQLLGLLNKAKYFFLFLFMEIVSFALIRKNNLQWDVNVFNSTNAVAANTMAATYKAKEYLYLKEENLGLANENKALRDKVVELEQKQGRPDAFYRVDSIYAQRFDFQVAKVINSTTARNKNYITIDKGRLDGIEPGMGVIGPRGVVGQVMSCSQHFSRIYSILHDDFRVSSEVTNQKLRESGQTALGLANWNGVSHDVVKLGTIDKFKKVSVGDSVVTSSQNLIFPPNILVGTIKMVATPDNGAFHDLDVTLATDFGGLTYVYVVNNKLVDEQLNLEREDENE